jgi:hypothetical protein
MRTRNGFLLPQVALVVVLLAIFPGLSHAGTWVAFGPQTYVQGPGSATAVTSSFSVLNPNTVYVLKINNGGLNRQFPGSTGVITLNGVRIVGPRELNPLIPVLIWPIFLRSNNQLGVELRGATGSGILLQIIGIDLGPPAITGTISPAPNAAGWNNSNVTVSFTCSDKTSGVASCPSPILLTNEGANQVVSGTVTDKAGNKATTSVTVNLDKTPPVISGTINPPPDAGHWNSPPVTVSFGCSDQLSGVASCSSPVTLTSEGPNQLVTGTVTDMAGNTSSSQVRVNVSARYFMIRSYGGKCLDYGSPWEGIGATVYLDDCIYAHPVRVEEINSHHDVILHAGSQVVGIHNPVPPTIGIAPPPALSEFPLELQDYDPALAADQVFVLDGDSIILAASRPCFSTDAVLCPPPLPQLVVQIYNARGASGSPLVAGVRNLADPEFWDFNPMEGSANYPTTGFLEVSTKDQLWNRVCKSPQANEATGAPPHAADGNLAPCATMNDLRGTVLLISSPNDCSNVPGARPGDHQDVGTCIDMSAYAPLMLPSGVTLRGDRRGTNLGPQLYAAYYTEKDLAIPAQNLTTPPQDVVPPDQNVGLCKHCMLQVHGDYVRITGLRLRGQSRSTDTISPVTGAVVVDPPMVYLGDFTTTTEYIALIDHNDMSDWMDSAIYVDGGHTETLTCDGVADDPATFGNVRIERNFLHHNERKDLGYGTGMAQGGRAFVSGNTFLMNRHSIAGDGEAHESYRASMNLVLSNVPEYDDGILIYHDFDMHGVGTSHQAHFFSPNGFGGVGGNYEGIFQNTFLGTTHHNYELRGYPCHNTDFQANVFLQSVDDALSFKPEEFLPGTLDYMNISPHQFEAPNSTDHLGVGDFDADGRDDLFLATGAAWYYAPAGNAEWRFLSAKTETLDQLLLGDFDGDGRTDVVAIQNGQFVISWGGVGDWEVLNPDPTSGRLLLLPSAVTAMAVGDFDGDGHADIFYADGTSWYVSSGGSGPFNFVNTSSFHVQDLRFGHFSICGSNGETDIFGIVAGKWHVSCGATSAWTPLSVSLTDHVDGLVVADFQGKGLADIATNSYNDWMIWYPDKSDWTHYQVNDTNRCVSPEPPLPLVPAIGNFDGLPGADVLLWDGGNEFCIASGGNTGLQIWSRQDMR